MALLELNHLHTFFTTKRGIVKAVNDVSYSVEAGKTLGVVGESGSGKSVSAYSLMRILTDNGRVTEGVAASHDPATPDGPATLADPWAAGAVGFVRGAGEWWLAHRGEPGVPDREALTAQLAAWLWAGPVGLLARDHPRAGDPGPAAPDPRPAHPAAHHPTAGDDAGTTPREQR